MPDALIDWFISSLTASSHRETLAKRAQSSASFLLDDRFGARARHGAARGHAGNEAGEAVVVGQRRPDRCSVRLDLGLSANQEFVTLLLDGDLGRRERGSQPRRVLIG